MRQINVQVNHQATQIYQDYFRHDAAAAIRGLIPQAIHQVNHPVNYQGNRQLNVQTNQQAYQIYQDYLRGATRNQPN